MKLNELKKDDKVRFRRVFGGKETVDFGIISSETDHAGYVEIRSLATNEYLGSYHKSYLIAKIIVSDLESYREELIEHPKPLVFDFHADEISFNCPRYGSPHSFMRGKTTYFDKFNNLVFSSDVLLPYNTCLQADLGGKFRVTIERID